MFDMSLLRFVLLLLFHFVSADMCIPSAMEMLSCPDGYVGIGPTCLCLQQECRWAYMKQYLPTLSLLQRYSIGPQRQECNGLFSSAFSNSLSIATSPTLSYPRHLSHSECELREVIATQQYRRQYHPCSVSIGKFLRFNSLHVYSQYNKRIPLHNVHYDFNWRWAQNITQCRSFQNRWNCAFASLSHTLKQLQKSHIPNAYLDSIVNLLPSQSSNHISQVLVYSHLLYLLATPSSSVMQFLNQHIVHTRSDINASALSVSLHVRHGDSCDIMVSSSTMKMNQRHCFDISLYMERLRDLRKVYNIERVYVATDSQELLKYISTEPDFDWVYINTSREMFDRKYGWIDFYNSSHSEHVTFSAVADLHLMTRGHIFLGAFSSHFSKLAYYLLVGKHSQIMPFISLDVPLSCDTVDNCSRNDIARRRQSIQRIIEWAPECLRKKDGGWLQNEEDACGVYI